MFVNTLTNQTIKAKPSIEFTQLIIDSLAGISTINYQLSTDKTFTDAAHATSRLRSLPD